MHGRNFSKLNGLITKLTAAANKAVSTDEKFKKRKRSVNALNDMPHHLNHIETGLRTPRFID